MSAKIVETWTRSKSGNDELNEDAFVITDDFVAVFDGETDKGDHGQPSPGRRAVRALVEAVECLPADSSAAHVVKMLHEAVATAAADGPSLVAVGALLNLRSRQVVRIGDVNVRIGASVHCAEKRIDLVAGCARAALLEARVRAGTPVAALRESDPGREMILPLLRAATVWRNESESLFGFAAIDGTSTPTSMIEVFEVPDSPTDVVLATDGYCKVLPSLAATEEALAGLIRADPLRTGPPPGTKPVLPGYESFDDRTYVRVWA